MGTEVHPLSRVDLECHIFILKLADEIMMMTIRNVLSADEIMMIDDDLKCHSPNVVTLTFTLAFMACTVYTL